MMRLADGLMAACAACWLIALLQLAPSWWRLLNAGGAALGRAVAWWMTGGLGWGLARVQIRQARQADRMAAILIEMADLAGARRSTARHDPFCTCDRCVDAATW